MDLRFMFAEFSNQELEKLYRTAVETHDGRYRKLIEQERNRRTSEDE